AQLVAPQRIRFESGRCLQEYVRAASRGKQHFCLQSTFNRNRECVGAAYWFRGCWIVGAANADSLRRLRIHHIVLGDLVTHGELRESSAGFIRERNFIRYAIAQSCVRGQKPVLSVGIAQAVVVVPQSGLDIEVRRELPGYIAKECVLGDDLGLKSNEHPGRESKTWAGFRPNEVLIKLRMQIVVEVACDPLPGARAGGGDSEFLAQLPLGVLLSCARTVRLRGQWPE